MLPPFRCGRYCKMGKFGSGLRDYTEEGTRERISVVRGALGRIQRREAEAKETRNTGLTALKVYPRSLLSKLATSRVQT